MPEVWRWGADIVVAIQAFHQPGLDTFFNIVTVLGSEAFYVALFPLLYWCRDKQLAQRLVVLFLFSAYSNAALKQLFGHPRPFEYDPQVLKLDIARAEELGYGLPSGHSQSAVTVSGYLAVSIRRRWMWILGVASVVLIAFSRIYLGVHFPSDVLGGLVLGAVWLSLFLWLEPSLGHWIRHRSMATQLGLALAVPVVLLLIHSSSDAVAATGTLIGLGAGMVIENRLVRFVVDGSFWRRAVRFLLGAIVVVILREGLRPLFPVQGELAYVPFRTLRYSLVGLWVALAGPWVFLRLGLAGTTDLEVG